MTITDTEALAAPGGMEGFLQTLIKRRGVIAEERTRNQQKGEAVLLLAREQGRAKLEDAEDVEFRGYVEKMKQNGAEIVGLDERIEEIRGEVERSGQINAGLIAIRKAESTMVSVKEQATYQKGDSRRSYMQDLIKMTMNLDGSGESRRRLEAHGQDVRTGADYAEYRAASRAEGEGGYAVPPIWLMDQYVELARPGRAFANLVQRQPLPPGTDSINIPKLLTGTEVHAQTADNTPVPESEITDTFINAPVRTLSGSQSVAIQLIDQSPVQFDDIVFRDLVAAHAGVTDLEVISGPGTAGHVLGISRTAGITTLALTGGQTIAGIYSALANAIQTVHTTRFMAPEVIVMHPRRWGWLQSLLDDNQRPLFLGSAGQPQNAAGILTDVESQQVVGNIQGLPIVTDPNIPTNLGTGTNEDPIYVLRASDSVLWESGIRARVLPEIDARNLGVLLQIYNYVAFSAGRYPQGIVEITGLTAPVWA